MAQKDQTIAQKDKAMAQKDAQLKKVMSTLDTALHQEAERERKRERNVHCGFCTFLVENNRSAQPKPQCNNS